MSTVQRLVLALSAALALLIPIPGVATAGAVGSTPISSFEYEFKGATIKLPTGCFFTHRISGSDRQITSEVAGSDCVGPGLATGPYCNWRIDFTYEDTKGRTYAASRGELNNSCTH